MKDVIVKREMYEKYIRNHYNVIFAIDDNPNIIALWRELDIPTLVVPGWDD